MAGPKFVRAVVAEFVTATLFVAGMPTLAPVGLEMLDFAGTNLSAEGTSASDAVVALDAGMGRDAVEAAVAG